MLKIGIIGMSPGNAHPYSWSAIINGQFDGEEITRIGYPAVAAYLEANRDTLGLPAAKVTHVWAQEREIAESICKAAGVTVVVNELTEMIGEVDAVILARDDPESHKEMARPFIEAGVPIFIDKPLAYSAEDLDWFSAQSAAGRFIMSCSSMRYANEVRVARQELKSLGKLELVTAVGKKDWKKYGIHLLEAIFAILDDPEVRSVKSIGELDREIVHLRLENGPDVTLHLFNEISGTFQVSLFGRNAWKLIDIRNSYSMFRDNLIEFIRSVEEGRPRLDFGKTERIVRVIVEGKGGRMAKSR
ncbi:Gfo/Idh/MocA family protein [Dyadobacter fermentans]|uniref:Oxidoreductase domain protein n=1 Tax=Dyadobacter fermentans (strain ATCC 700827 / DSM 18053 / CIP 107007 / KCTC 52180 / NS114) TaxID=471854 RepID=C6VUZ1_DYAFD|nr:Gfo/Idh/MocA family oxidoreductase [Dyadobacter fermentans]ACT93128.1 oxidoreductase domain protein [Dyadobacter fermentans DSM 18053]